MQCSAIEIIALSCLGNNDSRCVNVKRTWIFKIYPTCSTLNPLLTAKCICFLHCISIFTKSTKLVVAPEHEPEQEKPSRVSGYCMYQDNECLYRKRRRRRRRGRREVGGEVEARGEGGGEGGRGTRRVYHLRIPWMGSALGLSGWDCHLWGRHPVFEHLVWFLATVLSI